MSLHSGRARGNSTKSVITSSLAGTAVEYFDFYSYATAAALVFNKVFFPKHDPTVGTILAFGGIAVGFLARPIGSVLFGHLGDRVGRKSTLIITLSIMGFATCAIGLVPSYAQIGVAAPLLLMVLRIIQGIALGGEWGGAVLMSYEHGGRARAGFMTSFPQAAMPLGLILSTTCFLGLSFLPDAAFESWGWRVPFIASILLVIGGMIIRTRLGESPDFNAVKKDRKDVVPLLELFRTRKIAVVLSALSFTAAGFYFFAAYTFGLAYGKKALGLDYNIVLASTVVLAAVYLVTAIIAGALSDSFGRATVMLWGFALAAVTPLLFFVMLSSGSTPLLFGGFAMAGLSIGLMYGPYASLLCESFPTRVRFTGVSLGMTLGLTIGAAFTSMLFTELYRITNSWVPVALCVMVASVVSAGAAIALTRLRVTERSRLRTAMDPSASRA